MVLAPMDDAVPANTHIVEGNRVRITDEGSSVPDVIAGLVRQAAATWPVEWESVVAIAAGATGLATLVAKPDDALTMLSSLKPGAQFALATDAVTTHLGALGGRGGAIVAVGTGSIAFATDLHEVWHRVDGWGHLLGDRGAGAWIGIEALRAAMLAHDGVDTSGGALLDAATRELGAPSSWPAQLYTRTDRAGVLAGFVPAVVALAAAGDPRATTIMMQAGRHVAESLAAAFVPGIPKRGAASGGVFEAGGVFVESFNAEFARLAPDVELTAPLGTALDGAVTLARLLPTSRRPSTRPPQLWVTAP